MPGEVVMAQWFDVSPMRPGEWARTDIGQWHRVMQIRRAITAGTTDYTDTVDAEKRFLEKMGIKP